MELNGLKSHFWNGAEILRGSAIDRTDWKAYILPLLFFKRTCDVYDEETVEAIELFDDANPVDFLEVHRFMILLLGMAGLTFWLWSQSNQRKNQLAEMFAAWLKRSARGMSFVDPMPGILRQFG